MFNFSFFEISTLQRRILGGIGLVAIAGSVFLFRHSKSEEIPLLPPPITTVAATITVDVSGAVNQPGVYSLPANSRVFDAIKAAGAARSSADLSTVNQARIVRDGEQIYIDSKISGGGRVATTKRGPININRASAKDLEALPGIGPVLASRILEYRKSHGSFVTVDELQKVPGIGGSKFSQLKSKITI